MKVNRLIILALAAIGIASCGRSSSVGSGVPKGLAEGRSNSISGLEYSLHFDIPAEKDSTISASETIEFEYAGLGDLVLDFRPGGTPMVSVSVDGEMIHADADGEHITIPATACSTGHVRLDLLFTAGEQSLNRRNGFLYTLLVPDRARTLFPCFDQPDLKARYTLSLTVPDSWKAVSNTKVASETPRADGYRKIDFAKTEPLPTYLFSFVAGEFETLTQERSGRSVTMYHRETDPARLAQADDIFSLVFSALDYMEEYTGVPYPFAKYDFIVLPDFQYGGMEHTGATLYNDRRIFLSETPTTAELLDRASLISHETAHMWFGDYVTMRWFDDVWTKEVFANWFAAQMARPSFPEVNHVLNDMKSYFAPSYAEDRTVGSNAIQRPLGNLSDAGLIYCNIIYDKAPIMMDKLVRRMGQDAFREGVREYLAEFGYANASWDELIPHLQAHADFDVSAWSRVWVKEKGMPIYSAEVADSTVTVFQDDPFGQGNNWQQDLVYTAVGREGQLADLEFAFTGGDSARSRAPFEVQYLLPNTDGLGYGAFMLNDWNCEYIYKSWTTFSATTRMSLLMTLYENVWRRNVEAQEFVQWAASVLRDEPDPLILGSLLSYAVSAARMAGDVSELESELFAIASDPTCGQQMRLLCLRQLIPMMTDGTIVDSLYGVWQSGESLGGLSLGESDMTSLSYQLMIRFPDRYESIRETQLSRITNPDRRETFSFICKAVQPRREDRDAFFESLSDAANRRPESRVLTALSLLNHPLYQKESISYIRPALEMMEEIQRTGDIFFPSSWAKTLLGGYYSEEAAKEVRTFIGEHPDMNPLLMTKVLQAAGYLLQ